MPGDSLQRCTTCLGELWKVHLNVSGAVGRVQRTPSSSFVHWAWLKSGKVVHTLEILMMMNLKMTAYNESSLLLSSLLLLFGAPNETLVNPHVCCIAAPSSPRNVRILSVTDSTVQVSWWEPARANGVLQGYRIYFLHNNFTSVQTIRDNKSSMVETITRLSKCIQSHKHAYTALHSIMGKDNIFL